MSDQVKACPECDHHAVRPRSKRYDAHPAAGDGRWVCEECKATFDEPRERPDQSPVGGGHNMSAAGRAALEADVEVRGDD